MDRIHAFMAMVMLVFSNAGSAQLLNKTTANYSSWQAGAEIRGKSHATAITYYPTSGQLCIEDNLAAIRYNNIQGDTCDYLNVKPVALEFRASIPAADLYKAIHETRYGDLIRIAGILTINGKAAACIAYYAALVINPPGGDMLLDFNLRFDLDDYYPSGALPFNGPVELDIENGFVRRVE